MTRIVTLDEEAASLSEGALTLIKALKTFEADVLSKASQDLRNRHGLGSVGDQTKLCREALESLRERLMLEAAGNVVITTRR
jgi:hypothetical protein